MIVSGLSLGLMLGPIIGGPIIEFRGFPSLGSIMAGMNISMVSPCLFFRLNCTILLFFMVCPSLGRLAELRGTKHYQRLSSWRFVCILFLIAPFPHVLFNCIQPRRFEPLSLFCNATVHSPQPPCLSISWADMDEPIRSTCQAYNYPLCLDLFHYALFQCMLFPVYATDGEQHQLHHSSTGIVFDSGVRFNSPVTLVKCSTTKVDRVFSSAVSAL